MSIPSEAQSGFADASSYDTHRPSYPTEAVTKLLQHLNVHDVPEARILDLGAGTGKLTSLLAEREEEYEIIAVEPHADMRKVLEGKKLRGVEVVDGSSSNMKGMNGDWADAVICAQAFHWFADMPSLHEIHRVLGPGCTLGLIWNIEDYNSRIDWKPTTKWEGKLKDIIFAREGPGLKTSRFRHNKWREVFENQLKTTPATIQSANPIFSLPLGEEVVEWTVWLSTEGIWDRLRTISHISILEGKELEGTKKEVFEAIEGGDDIERNEKGEAALHGKTVFYWTTAVPGDTLQSGG